LIAARAMPAQLANSLTLLTSYARVNVLLATIIPMKGKDTSSLNREIVKLAQYEHQTTSRVKLVGQ